MRGGRFTEKIEFKEADLNGALELAKNWVRTTKAKLDPTMSVNDVAALLEGESPANIKAILQQAINTMIERKASTGISSVVTLSDVQSAKEVVLGG